MYIGIKVLCQMYPLSVRVLHRWYTLLFRISAILNIFCRYPPSGIRLYSPGYSGAAISATYTSSNINRASTDTTDGATVGFHQSVVGSTYAGAAISVTYTSASSNINRASTDTTDGATVGFHQSVVGSTYASAAISASASSNINRASTDTTNGATIGFRQSAVGSTYAGAANGVTTNIAIPSSIHT